MNETGEVLEQSVVEDESQSEGDGGVEILLLEFSEQEPPVQRKYYFDGGSVEIAAQVVYELDAEGKQLRVVSYTDYAREQVKAQYRSPQALETDWRERKQRRAILDTLIGLQAALDAADVTEFDSTWETAA